MVFIRNVNIYNYTHKQVENLLKDQNKCTAIVTYSNREKDIMTNDKDITAVYVISRKDLKKNIAHYRIHVYNEDFALIFIDDEPYDMTKFNNFTSMYPSTI